MKTCKYCGVLFGGKRGETCNNPSCKKKYKAEYSRWYNEEHKKLPPVERKPRINPKAPSIAEVQRMARAAGMSYGQYVLKKGL